MNKKEIQPCTTNLCEVCKQIYDKKEEGVNSLQTLNPDGHIKKHCAKLNGGVDAVAVADKQYRKINDLFIGSIRSYYKNSYSSCVMRDDLKV